MSDVAEESSALPALPREHLVAAAVRFLSSPKVGASSDQQKAVFLKKKGLTDDEINEAFLRSSAVSYSVERTTRTFMGARPVSRMMAVLQTACHVIVVFFGGGYIIYLLVKRYVIPWLTGQRSKSKEEKLAKLQSSLDDSVRSMQTCLQGIQTQVGEQQHALDRLARPVSPEPAQMQRELSQLRAEVSSLKALLLSRHQFAAAPSPPPVPAIPSWQLTKSDAQVDSKSKANSSSSGEIVIVSGNNSDNSDHHSDN